MPVHNSRSLNYMKALTKLLFLILFPITFTSCSLISGGFVALDNDTSTGPKEIGYQDLIKLHEGRKIILELKDSTKISGLYKGYSKSTPEGNKKVITIKVLDETGELKSIEISEVKKYVYIDEGGSVWAAVATGAAIDAVLIYAFIRSHHGIGIGPGNF
ncbi:MAG: hypothetical protein ACM3QX_17645 [Syntrophomonadaceae bacterium]